MKRTTTPGQSNRIESLDEREHRATEAAHTLHRSRRRWWDRKPRGRPKNVPQRKYPRMGEMALVDLTFVKVPTELALSDKLARKHLLVWWYVSMFENHPYGCYQTNQWIGSQLGLSQWMVQEALRDLWSLGLVRRTLCAARRAASNRSLWVVRDFKRVMVLRSQYYTPTDTGSDAMRHSGLAEENQRLHDELAANRRKTKELEKKLKSEDLAATKRETKELRKKLKMREKKALKTPKNANAKTV